jgi:hypothetical protein
MASFVHTCDRCGAQMQVHERYIGHMLKCTSCRAEFEAVVPPRGLGPAAPAVPAPRPAAPERSVLRFWPALLLLIPLLGFVAWLNRDEAPPETAFRDQHAVGDVAALDTGTTRPVLVALDREAVAALVDMRTGTIQLGVSALMSNQERYLELEAGTRVRVLAYANEDREAKVRVLDGPAAEQEVWVPRRWLR